VPIRALALALLAALSLPASALEIPPEGLVIRASWEHATQLDAITHLLGHAQVDRAKRSLRTEATADLLAALRQAGMKIEVDAEASAGLQRLHRAMAQPKSIPGYACYRTVEETRDELAALAGAYPQLLAMHDIGESWQTAQGNAAYPLQVLVATNTDIPGPKPRLFLLSSIHAREYTPAELATRFIEDLVLGHGKDPEATWLLDQHEVHALLQGNPDGRKRAETGESWRKNHNTTHCPGSFPSFRPGVDLNRNYPFEWGQHGGSSGSACQDTYRGPSPASEPETQAVVDYVRAHFPDRRGPLLTDPADVDTQGIFFDIHSYSQLVLWPWGFTNTVAPNGPALAKLGRRLAWFNGYTAEQAIGLYATDGTTDDFAYGELGLPAYTFELGSAFFQNCADFENVIYPQNSAALRYAARSLHAPYRLPFGPDAFDLRVEPDLVLVGNPATLHARLDDARMQTRVTGASGPVPPVQAVVSASAYLSTAPWEAGATALPMQAGDGAFDSPDERAQLDIDTSSLATGRHIVYVQGMDADGNAGPPNAAFIDVLAPEDAAHISGSVRQIGTDLPLQAQVRTGSWQTESDPATGDFARILPPGPFDLEVSAPGHETELRFGYNLGAGETLHLPISLYRLCPLIEDPVEIATPSAFSAQLPWTLRAEQGNGGGAAWLPTAGATYANNLNISLTSAVLDLRGFASPQLSFDSRCDTEAGWDYGRVEVSLNGGAGWSEVFRCDGETAWRRVELPLPQLADIASARLRFRFTSDTSVVAPGWAIDNVLLSAGGEACRAGQAPQPVQIDAFSADPTAIVAGEDSLLSWSTAHASACVIEADDGSDPTHLAFGQFDAGSLSVSPDSSIAYTLRCEGEQGPVEASASISVSPPPPPPPQILAFAADPASIVAGASSSLMWQTADTEACELGNDLDPAVVGVPTTGQLSVAPAQSITYILRCSGNGDLVEAGAAIEVSPPPPPPPPPQILSFSASPTAIIAGASSTLAWQTSNAEACELGNSLDSATEAVPLTGLLSVSPPQSLSYTLRCSAGEDVVEASASVAVNQPAPDPELLRDGFEPPTP
jgi:carboxypeptidase T